MLIAVDPTTGVELRRVEPADEAGREEILAAAAAAAPPWRGASFDRRGALLRGVAARLRAERERLALLMCEEMGKPIREGRGEVDKAAWCAEHYAEHGEHYLATERLTSDASSSYVQYLPLGPVLGILPWNAPLWLAFRFCAPALMAGNPCVMKHDPHVPGCAAAIGAIFDQEIAEHGAPAGVFINLPLATEDVEEVIRDPRIRAVSFTGSDRGGAAVAAVAGSVIKPVVLELGGSDPGIVLADADLDEAARVLALSRIINAGQSCIAAKRLLVEEPVYEPFVERLEAQLSAFRVGDPRSEQTDVGPIAGGDLRRALAAQVEETVTAGARCLLGGEVPEGGGFFYPVTLLAEVPTDSAAFREETFGPVAAVTRVGDAEEAIELANDTPYGLGAGLWTQAARGEAMARQIETGQVAVNGIVKTDPRLPSGGVKRSGYGRELGPHGIREFVNAQQVWVGPART